MRQMLLQPVFVRDDEGNGIGTLVVIQDQLVDLIIKPNDMLRR